MNTLPRKRIPILAEQMTELIDSKGGDMKIHSALRAIRERQYYSIDQPRPVIFGPVVVARKVAGFSDILLSV